MVWRNSSNKKNNLKLKTLRVPVAPKKIQKTQRALMVDKLLKKSGMWHGIDDVTGKKIKDAFVDRELKKNIFYCS